MNHLAIGAAAVAVAAAADIAPQLRTTSGDRGAPSTTCADLEPGEDHDGFDPPAWTTILVPVPDAPGILAQLRRVPDLFVATRSCVTALLRHSRRRRRW